MQIMKKYIPPCHYQSRCHTRQTKSVGNSDLLISSSAWNGMAMLLEHLTRIVIKWSLPGKWKTRTSSSLRSKGHETCLQTRRSYESIWDYWRKWLCDKQLSSGTHFKKTTHFKVGTCEDKNWLNFYLREIEKKNWKHLYSLHGCQWQKTPWIQL